MKTKKICGQPSYELKSKNVDLAVTKEGGHCAPVTFRCGGKTIRPFSVVPWCDEKVAPGIDRIAKNLRGDFFCLPFGGNTTPIKKLGYGTKQFSFECHGDPANAEWDFEESQKCKNGAMLHLSQTSKKIKGLRVDKRLYARAGQSVIYSEHTVSGLNAQMPVGHHPTLDFTGKTTRISAGPFKEGFVNPTPFENPAQGGYQALKEGARFTSLKKVPTICGTTADLSVYPARRGFEDLALLLNDPKADFAWVSAVVQKEGWLYFALKDPKVLAATVLWISNGGRHYAPWNGRHTDRIGLEDVTSYFAYGWAESQAPNALKKKDVPTTIKFSSKKPTKIRYIMGVAAVPKNFDEVAKVEKLDDGKIRLTALSGATADVAVNLGFLREGQAAFGCDCDCK